MASKIRGNINKKGHKKNSLARSIFFRKKCISLQIISFVITPANVGGARGDTSRVASLINQDRTTLSTLVYDNRRKLLKLRDGPCYGAWHSYSHLSVTNYLQLFSCEQMLQFLWREGLLQLMQILKKGNYKTKQEPFVAKCPKSDDRTWK